jgi:hypothetical protein
MFVPKIPTRIGKVVRVSPHPLLRFAAPTIEDDISGIYIDASKSVYPSV